MPLRTTNKPRSKNNKIRRRGATHRNHLPLYVTSVLFVLLIIVSVIFIIVQLQPSPTPQIHLQPGMVAPDFQLNAVRGGTIRLQDLKGCTVLLSFLSTQANATDSPISDPSRSQVTFLKSMDQQYDPRGARVVIIDATALLTGQQPDQNALLNFTYDWDLTTIKVTWNTALPISKHLIRRKKTDMFFSFFHQR